MMAPETRSVLLRPVHTERLRLRKRHLGSVNLISIKLFTSSDAKHQRKKFVFVFAIAPCERVLRVNSHQAAYYKLTTIPQRSLLIPQPSLLILRYGPLSLSLLLRIS